GASRLIEVDIGELVGLEGLRATTAGTRETTLYERRHYFSGDDPSLRACVSIYSEDPSCRL
nr:hypothetical protein [Tanacetum cinerariifolium]